MANTVRTSISVPVALRARMDAAGEPVNWSAVCCRAIEGELSRIIQRKGTASMTDVIQRLRASKQSSDAGRNDEGFGFGKAWAESTAEAVELERLEDFAAGFRDLSSELVDDDDSAYTPAQLVFFAIAPMYDGERGPAGDFWEQRTKTDVHPRAAFVRGFIDGALDLWSEVKHRL